MNAPLVSVPTLMRRLGTFDAALIVIGGIIGSGIYMNPSVVARHANSASLVILLWVAGGAIALMGAGVFAELAARRPQDGGLYAYIRDAFHPVLAFMYGWTLLLVAQTGSIALAAITFAVYIEPVTSLHISTAAFAVIAILTLTCVNVFGVRSGASAQNLLMMITVTAIIAFVVIGLFASRATTAFVSPVSLHSFSDGAMIAALGLAMVPVLFAYDGWQTASFISAELKEPAKMLPRGLIVGVLVVAALYIAVNASFLRALGVSGLAATGTPASEIAQHAFGSTGRRIVAIIVALSTLGFLSNQILVSPRVYFQMAADGAFFKQLAWVHTRTRVPLVAVLLQGCIAAIIALSGTYEQILNYVTSIDYVFFGLAALALIVFRSRDARDPVAPLPFFRMPGHPWTTVLFGLAAWGIVADVLIKSPVDTSIGFGILITGIPVYALFAWRNAIHRNPKRVETPV